MSAELMQRSVWRRPRIRKKIKPRENTVSQKVLFLLFWVAWLSACQWTTPRIRFVREVCKKYDFELQYIFRIPWARAAMCVITFAKSNVCEMCDRLD